MENLKSMVKVEGNLIEYPFFHLGGTRKKEVYKEHDLGERTLDNGLVVKRRLIVKNTDGIPVPYDQDVLMGILRIGTRTGTLTEDIRLTVYGVAKEIDDLRNQFRVRKSIERLVTTNYKSEQVILVKESETKYYLDDLFHILESASFLRKEEKNKRKSREETKVRFNRFFISNFLNDYYKYIDLKTYLRLKTPTAKKLYLYLEKKKFEKEVFQANLDFLANILPLEVKECYDIKRILKKAHERLIGEYIIRDFRFEKDKVLYFFPKEKKEIGKKDLETFKDVEKKEVFERLVELGVTKLVARDMVEKYKLEDIKSQIEYLRYRKGENLPGILVKAIAEEWASPPEYLEKKRKEKIEVDLEAWKKKYIEDHERELFGEN